MTDELTGFTDGSAEVTEQDIKMAQDRLLDSRASYVLRNDVVDSVLTARPILQAVHHGINATPAERYSSSVTPNPHLLT